MFFKENKIDALMKYNERLRVRKQKLEDKKNEKNSKLETKTSALDTKRKALVDKSIRNDEIYKNQAAEIDRLIDKNNKQMTLESNYYKTLVTPNKTKKRR